MKNEILIEAAEIKKYYQLGEIEVKALDGINIEVISGEFLAIVGPSGSGKSTLINMLGGVDKPDTGQIIIENVDIAKYNIDQLTEFRRANVGFVFQFYSLIPTLTAYENVEMAAELINLRGNDLITQSNKALDYVGLGKRKNSYPSQLSGGERQRVAIARALAKEPKLILVDEPTGQLDEVTADQVVKLIRDTSKQIGATVLMVTHDNNQLKYADRVIEMKSGKIIGERK
ncbi:MAG: ABC transporter ATP-binding protein [Candidatus Kariarchaeum pelagius]